MDWQRYPHRYFYPASTHHSWINGATTFGKVDKRPEKWSPVVSIFIFQTNGPHRGWFDLNTRHQATVHIPYSFQHRQLHPLVFEDLGWAIDLKEREKTVIRIKL